MSSVRCEFRTATTMVGEYRRAGVERRDRRRDVSLELTVQREDDRISLRGVACVAVGERDVDRAPLAEDLGVDRVGAGDLDGAAGGLRRCEAGRDQQERLEKERSHTLHSRGGGERKQSGMGRTNGIWDRSTKW